MISVRWKLKVSGSDSVTLQTNWKLEHYYKSTAVSNCNNLEPTPAEHDEHDELVQPSGSSTTEVSSLNGPKGRTGTVSLLRSCTASCIPQVPDKSKKSFPWINKQILQTIAKRNTYYRLLKSTDHECQSILHKYKSF